MVRHRVTRQIAVAGIDVLVADLHHEVHVRSGRKAGHADMTDHLSLRYDRAFRQFAQFPHVAVVRFISVVVIDHDIVAVDGLIGVGFNDAGIRRVDVAPAVILVDDIRAFVTEVAAVAA